MESTGVERDRDSSASIWKPGRCHPLRTIRWLEHSSIGRITADAERFPSLLGENQGVKEDQTYR